MKSPKQFDENEWHSFWVQFGETESAVLHRVADDVSENNNHYAATNYTGSTVCGRFSDFLIMPGVFSRIGAPRCQTCCSIMKIPRGKGNPYNEHITPC